MRRLLVIAIFFLTTLVSITSYAESEFIQRPEVQSFIDTMVKKHRFYRKDLVRLFSEVKIREQIMQSMNKPAEKGTWNMYQKLFVSEWRIQHGVKFWHKYADVLRRAEKTYGVPASIIVATIGIESRYGERIGDFRVMDSLTNIAFSQSSRAAYFKTELEQFLLLTREQHVNPLKIMGSYAGAIGQPQFMPSSYRRFAVNFSKSGKTDLMNNEVDVIGSVANYYKQVGWTPNMPVAIPALAIGDRYNYLIKKGRVKQPMTIKDLSKYGVVPKKSPRDEDLKVKVIELKSRYSKEYWLGYHNFDVIKRYNASDLYAMAVFQLSGYITELKERTNNG